MRRWWNLTRGMRPFAQKSPSVGRQLEQLRTQIADIHRESERLASHRDEAIYACFAVFDAQTKALCELVDRQGVESRERADRWRADATEMVRSLTISMHEGQATLAELFPTRGELGFDDPRSPTSLFRQKCLLAQQETVAILNSSMSNAVCEFDHRSFLLKTIAASRSRGHLLEFGVFNGTTLRWMAEAFPDRQFTGFDSFRGLPTEWSGYKTFDFDRGGVAPTMPSNVRLVAGSFEETLPSFLETIDEVGFLHIDCDLYSSARYVLHKVIDKMGKGSTVVFDEYFNYPGFQQHEYRACAEVLSEAGLTIEWLFYSGERAAGRLLY